MDIQKGLKYTKDHEWVRIDGNKAYIGITDFAQLALGDIVYVELPNIGKKLGAGDVLGVVESVKTASDIYTPIGGTVVEVNEELSNSPEKINEEPYESWIAVLEIENGPEELEAAGLMDEEEYKEYCKSEAK